MLTGNKIYFQVQPTRCNVTQFIYFCEMLYMFQAILRPSSGAQTVYTASGTLLNLCCYLLMSWKRGLHLKIRLRCMDP